MKILLLNQFYLPDVAPTGQLLADLAGELARGGHQVHVVCTRGAYGGGEKRLSAGEIINGVHVHRVSACGFGRNNSLGRLADYLSFYVLALFKAFALPAMDVCVCLTTPPFIGFVGAGLKLMRGTPLVLWTMDLYPQIMSACGFISDKSLLYRLLRWLAKRLYRHGEKIVALGEVMAERLVQAGADPEKIITVHNWVPGESVRPIHRKNSQDGKITLMYSGNLGLGHELDTVLRGVAKLGSTTNLRILFVGRGKMLGQLQALAEELKLDCVDFLPPQPLAKLSESLAAGDIHLVAQRDGTQGLIVPSKIYGILAAGRGAVFIGPDDCEVAQIIRDGDCGIVIKPGDVDGFSQALEKILRGEIPIEQLASRARQYYTENFSMKRSVAALTDCIVTAAEN